MIANSEFPAAFIVHVSGWFLDNQLFRKVISRLESLKCLILNRMFVSERIRQRGLAEAVPLTII
jgi:hypothetical protein